ncbi:MAG: glycosyltransferase, partial [Candidatus Binatia bacterium]
GAVRRPMILAVAGTGPYAAAYRDVVRREGWSDVVRFLGHRTDVADLMVAADVVVLPSVAEAFGLALAEALYLGTPVVASRVGGIPEIVEDGVDGLLVPAGDRFALATSIASLLEDSELRQKMAGAARDRVKAKFSFQEMLRGYEGLYQRWSEATSDGT